MKLLFAVCLLNLESKVSSLSKAALLLENYAFHICHDSGDIKKENKRQSNLIWGQYSNKDFICWLMLLLILLSQHLLPAFISLDVTKRKTYEGEGQAIFNPHPFIFPSNLDAHTEQWAFENNGLWPW